MQIAVQHTILFPCGCIFIIFGEAGPATPRKRVNVNTKKVCDLLSEQDSDCDVYLSDEFFFTTDKENDDILTVSGHISNLYWCVKNQNYKSRKHFFYQFNCRIAEQCDVDNDSKLYDYLGFL